MFLFDRTFPSPAENLACDESLLALCEEGFDAQILRLWEPAEHFVVLGYTNRAREEVNLEACRSRGIPVLRRYSGGGTVLQGPGCLNYSLIIRIPDSGPFSTITGTSAEILRRNAVALQPLIGGWIDVRGTSDLTIDGRKFSGNAQRRGRRFLLFHGTFLHAFDLHLVGSVLRMPSRQPEYRANRSHAEFLRTIDLAPGTIKDALRTAWDAASPLTAVSIEQIRRLATARYANDAWTFRL